jgi:hypothetical protein
VEAMDACKHTIEGEHCLVTPRVVRTSQHGICFDCMRELVLFLTDEHWEFAPEGG